MIKACRICGNTNIEVFTVGKKMGRKCQKCGNASKAIRRVGGVSMYRAKRQWNKENE